MQVFFNHSDVNFKLFYHRSKTPTPEDKYGDSRVSEFYTWKSAIPEQAGKLLKQKRFIILIFVWQMTVRLFGFSTVLPVVKIAKHLSWFQEVFTYQKERRRKKVGKWCYGHMVL